METFYIKITFQRQLLRYLGLILKVNDGEKFGVCNLSTIKKQYRYEIWSVTWIKIESCEMFISVHPCEALYRARLQTIVLLCCTWFDATGNGNGE